MKGDHVLKALQSPQHRQAHVGGETRQPRYPCWSHHGRRHVREEVERPELFRNADIIDTA